ncbi:hypothetical protein, partial [Burkholderia cenocepacia]|uniref:hypothetical protein n=1 Tax=Burkholderia cenocepacia TaxID=95486 RepID=UPI002DD65829
TETPDRKRFRAVDDGLRQPHDHSSGGISPRSSSHSGFAASSPRLGVTGPLPLARPSPRSPRRAASRGAACGRFRVRVGVTVRCPSRRRSSVDPASFVCRAFEAVAMLFS